MSGNKELIQKCWGPTQTEYSKGWLSGPKLVTKFDKSNAILSPRFCIRERHGVQEVKYRVIDDLTKSRVNIAVEMADTYFPQDIDTFMVIARLNHTYGAENLRMWSVDFPNAYKNISLGESSPRFPAFSS